MMGPEIIAAVAAAAATSISAVIVAVMAVISHVCKDGGGGGGGPSAAAVEVDEPNAPLLDDEDPGIQGSANMGYDDGGDMFHDCETMEPRGRSIVSLTKNKRRLHAAGLLLPGICALVMVSELLAFFIRCYSNADEGSRVTRNFVKSEGPNFSDDRAAAIGDRRVCWSEIWRNPLQMWYLPYWLMPVVFIIVCLQWLAFKLIKRFNTEAHHTRRSVHAAVFFIWGLVVLMPAIAAGIIFIPQDPTVVRSYNASVFAVGDNVYGGLGDSSYITRYIARPMAGDIATRNSIKQVAAGEGHTLILLVDGSVWAVGSNEAGQLGDGMQDNRNVPYIMHTPTTVQQIAAAGDFSVFLKRDGQVWAVGGNSYGQLGDGTKNNRSIAKAIISLQDDNARVATGSTGFTLVLKSERSIMAMGNNFHGHLGLEPHPVLVPTTVSSAGSNNAKLAAGHGHTILVKENGHIFGMGLNGHGQLGDNTTEDRSVPVEMALLGGDNREAAAGACHTVVLKGDGQVVAVGCNSRGQLGDGTLVAKSMAVAMQWANADTSLADNRQVAAGAFHTVILGGDRRVFAAGCNLYGQLGIGVNATEGIVPGCSTPDYNSGQTLVVPLLGRVNTISCAGADSSGNMHVAAGMYHTVVVRNETASCG
jgi:alpha-tubulin suppressor-like RCC1 family protein